AAVVRMAHVWRPSPLGPVVPQPREGNELLVPQPEQEGLLLPAPLLPVEEAVRQDKAAPVAKCRAAWFLARLRRRPALNSALVAMASRFARRAHRPACESCRCEPCPTPLLTGICCSASWPCRWTSSPAMT